MKQKASDWNMQLEFGQVMIASDMPYDDHFDVYKRIIDAANVREVQVRRVWQMLRKTNKKMPATIKDLVAWLDTDGAVIRKCVRVLREMEIPICAGSKGLFYSTDEADIMATSKQLMTKAKSTYVVAAIMKRIATKRRLEERMKEYLDNDPDES